MNEVRGRRLLDGVLDGWDRSNQALLNLLRLVPADCLDARAQTGSPTIAEMFTHLHHERMVSVLENVPECAGPVPEREWNPEPNPDRIAAMLTESAATVRRAVESRIQADGGLDRDFRHPVQLLQFLIFHEGYHHGQIKLALKAAGRTPADDDVGPLIWDVWRAR